MNNIFSYRIDALGGVSALAVALFTILTLLYSFKFMQGKKHLIQYYTYIIVTSATGLGCVLTNNLLMLLVSWGITGLTLFLLINMGDEHASLAAKKTFVIVGGSDALMLLGIGIIYYLSGTFDMDKIRIPLAGLSDTPLAYIAYICLACGSLAKAGAMPFHTWIPGCAKSAPLPVVAYLPASMDKVLGIYLLARISLGLFEVNAAIQIFLMLIGAFTIIAAVMMALVQHNMKKLMGYHAVSQVGYMVLGIGTGNPIGIAGGLFHMLNHAVYKSCLFLTAGNVEYRAKTTELDELGGLSKYMPLTYICCLIASLSISGVPPFNGFVSKWMIYQGLIERLNAGGSGRLVTVLCLVAAMFGSALTLASFMKLMHAVYFGQRTAWVTEKKAEVSWMMWLPCAVLATICVIFGVFARQLPLKYFIFPVVGTVSFIGAWYPGLSVWLIIISLSLGILIFRAKSSSAVRRDAAFVGGEPLDLNAHPVTGVDFYNTISEYGIFKGIYKKAEAGYFDIYEQGKNLVFGIGRFFQYLHNGVLPTYLVWTLLGMLGLFWVLFAPP